jgi:hypothetical protein
MMKNISKYIALLLILSLSFSTSAQEGDAMFNKITKTYTLNDDGSYDYREYKELKLLSHMSFHRLYGETFIIFDPEYQEIVINEAYTIMRDGKKVLVPDNAFNEVLPRAASNAAPYNRLRELVITHTGLEVGATICLDYTLKTKAGFMQTFMGEEQIKDIVPIKEKKLVFRIPADRELHYNVLNIRTGPEITEEKGMNVYTFTFNGLSENVYLWGNDHESEPVLFFSAANDLERAYFPFVAQKAFTYPANQSMTNAAQNLKEEAPDELAAVLGIQKMVADEIGTWNIPLEYTGFTCRSPVETWRSNAGTPLEKNILLATLLQHAGFRAEPVAIIPRKYYDSKVGSLFVIESFAVRVNIQDGPIIITATSISAQDLGVSEKDKLFLVLDGAIESLKTYEGENVPAEITYHGDFSLDMKNTLTGNLVVKLTGNVNPYFSLSLDSAYAKRYGFNAKEVGIKTLEKQESNFDLTIEKEQAMERYGDYAFMEIPGSRAGISSWGFNYIEKDRNTPIKLPEAIHEQYHFMIDVPEGYELISPAVDIELDNAVGTVKISLRQESNKVFVTREITLKKELVQLNEFYAFNTIWNAWMNASFKKLSFKIQE